MNGRSQEGRDDQQCGERLAQFVHCILLCSCPCLHEFANCKADRPIQCSVRDNDNRDYKRLLPRSLGVFRQHEKNGGRAKRNVRKPPEVRGACMRIRVACIPSEKPRDHHPEHNEGLVNAFQATLLNERSYLVRQDRSEQLNQLGE